MKSSKSDELNEWIANLLGWQQVDEQWRRDIGQVPHATVYAWDTSPPTYTSRADLFAEVKREIERRGWSWMATGSSRHHRFAIWDRVKLREDGTYSTPSGFALELARDSAESEELAGCLALKGAVEMTGDP